MNNLSLYLFLVVNLAMIGICLFPKKGEVRIYEFPFWAGIINLGFFGPMAIRCLPEADAFPEGAYAGAMLFASLCCLFCWLGFVQARKRKSAGSSWLAASFDDNKLFYAAAGLCIFGFYFQYKLWSLPEELLNMSQWSGATTKYLFFASTYKFGLLILLLLYWRKPAWRPKILAFLLPSLLILFGIAFLRGRRAEMMNLLAYLIVPLWFVRRIAIPRLVLGSGLVAGLIFIGGIGLYRTVMIERPDLSLKERFALAWQQDYYGTFTGRKESSPEFMNYVYNYAAYSRSLDFDYGLRHWNALVFNYVPAQIVGYSRKESLMLSFRDPRGVVEAKYGYAWRNGSTSTGFSDAFLSFWWFGVIKFWLAGWIMGALYRRAMESKFLAIFLYACMLKEGMQAFTHSTHGILVRDWVYFFTIAFPLFYWAKSVALPKRILTLRRTQLQESAPE